MSFPIDYQKEFCWPATMRNEKAVVEAFARIAGAELQEARASDVEADDHTIQFTVRRFRWVGNTNLLTNIDKGVIEITRAAGTFCVAYYLSFKRFLLHHCLIALLAVWVFSFATRRAWNLQTTLNVLTPVLVFSIAFALNYLIAVRRFSRCIKRIISRADLESAGI